MRQSKIAVSSRRSEGQKVTGQTQEPLGQPHGRTDSPPQDRLQKTGRRPADL
ncbi:MAG: hypothetical protein KME26_12740 [Oscillatoria princeps RMCB-10]|nr:hypothetical protein [Oscillatoria princeps RMCB-10]